MSVYLWGPPHRSHPSVSLCVFRYEVNFQSGIDCGGAYVKLLTQTPELDLVRLTLCSFHSKRHVTHLCLFLRGSPIL